MPATILYAEDDKSIRTAVTTAFELEGFNVVSVNDGQSALDWLDSNKADLIVLDVMMPFVDGLTVCRRIRSRRLQTPVLMLTARTETSDQVSGLDAGADAYLPKPFDVDALLANVRALLRRANYSNEQPVDRSVGDLRVDESARRAWRGQRELELTKTEFDLLLALVVNAGVVLSHTTLYELVWQYDFGPDSKTLAVYISYLRKKLELPGESVLLHTMRGVGYTLRAS